MELISDSYHLSKDVLREMTVDVLNWLDWRIGYNEHGHLIVTACTEQGEVRLDLEIIACGDLADRGSQNPDAQEPGTSAPSPDTLNPESFAPGPGSTPEANRTEPDDKAHCLRVSFPQTATGSAGVLLDELHAAALKRTQG